MDVSDNKATTNQCRRRPLLLEEEEANDDCWCSSQPPSSSSCCCYHNESMDRRYDEVVPQQQSSLDTIPSPSISSNGVPFAATDTAASATSATPTTTSLSGSTVSLSRPLWWLYCLDGINLALPMTALLYFINDYVQIPIVLLPSYAAIAFLPCSLKPLYAYLSSSLSSAVAYCCHRHVQMTILWTLAGITFAITPHVVVPQQRHHGVVLVLCFTMAFLRGLFTSWPEFLLGLTLIDEATAVSELNSESSSPQRPTVDNNELLLLRPHSLTSVDEDDPRTAIPNTAGNNPLQQQQQQSMQHDLYCKTVALFQAQSATARSIGCVMSHIFVLFFYWGVEEWTSRSTTTTTSSVLNYTTMNIPFGITGGMNLISAIISTLYRVGYQTGTNSIKTQNNNFQRRDVSPSVVDMLLATRTDTSTVDRTTHTTLTTTTTRQHVDESQSHEELSQPLLSGQSSTLSRCRSYNSLISPNGNECAYEADPLSKGGTSPIELFEVETPSQLHEAQTMQVEANAYQRQCHDESHSSGVSHNTVLSVGLVVLLQVAVVILTMRQPIQHATSVQCWYVLTCVVGLTVVLTAVAGCIIYYRRYGRNSQQLQFSRLYRVGFFLILRHAIPSVSYLMSSYFYTVFASTPSFLQLLSLLDMVVTTVACWTYGKFLSCYSHGPHLLYFIAGTTALAAVVSLGNIELIHILDPNDKSHFTFWEKIGATVVLKIILGVTSEWKFLPDLVLATVSASASLPVQVRSTHNPSVVRSVPRCLEQVPLGEEDSPVSSSTVSATSATVGMQYGALVSCIDFGGQLGAIFAGPLVALFGTTRENDWAHLDWLQATNSTLMLLSIGMLWLLVRK